MQDGQLESFTLKRAADNKPDNQKPEDQDNGSSKRAGIAFDILGALLALIGGGFFASQQGILPKQITDMLPF